MSVRRRDLTQQHGPQRMSDLMEMVPLTLVVLGLDTDPIFSQLKSEYEHTMAETTTCKRQRDEFEMKCELRHIG